MLTKEGVAEQLRSMQAKIAAQDAIIYELVHQVTLLTPAYVREKRLKLLGVICGEKE